MAVPRNALKKWEKVRGFALSLPGAAEEFPWGGTVAKAGRKVFVFLGVTDGSHPLGLTVKLVDEAPHAHALSVPGAAPARYGLGRAGWVSVPLADRGAPAAGVLCDWIEESYRAVVPRRLAAELDALRRVAGPPHRVLG
ncbi:MmcQ/YjbR family DNA-binding protein [Streptomyces sp. NPDC005573]|uniref:MmcQ/YjbR family DNA-binding protein n=1 Tax=Streptomyces sp. NPDC005573 TaxID=3156890 RepID=UPI0033A6AF42